MTTAPRTLLIVDDDDAIRDLLVELLTMHPFDCLAVSSAQAAMDAIDEKKPSLLLCDWDLGEQLTGTDVIAHSRTHAPDTMVVLMTGRNLQPLMSDTSIARADAYLKKPFSVSELLAILDDI